jgi:hypothetical protein
MEFIQPNILTPFEVTYGDTGLFVQAAIYNATTGSAVFSSDVNMTEVVTGSYVGWFTPAASSTYFVVKRVFTDGTYSVLNPNYLASSETVQVGSVAGSMIGAQAIVAHISVPTIQTEVELADSILGSVGSATQTIAEVGPVQMISADVSQSTLSAGIESSETLTASVPNPEISAEVNSSDQLTGDVIE